MTLDLSEISFDTLWHNIKGSISGLHRESEYYLTITPEKLLKPLRQAVSKLGKEPVPTPPPNPETLKEEWAEYVSGKRESLNRRTIFYLCWCWESGIALDKRFIHYIEANNILLRWKAIYALVRSCHMTWDNESARGPILKKLRGLLVSYSGPNQLLNIWKKNIEMILDVQGPKMFASKMTEASTPPSEILKEWGIDVQSEFARVSVRLACEICLQKIGKITNHNVYLIKSLLHWENWELSAFKKRIESILLHNAVESIREDFQDFVLKDERLGNPLVSRNQQFGSSRIQENPNWSNISESAKRKFITWITRENIIFFFDHVLPDGHDPHGRKDFWLRYVNKFIARPLLSSNDERRLRQYIEVYKDKIAHRGQIKGSYSAFILDFGHMIAVEFSKSGKCYIFTESEFKQIYSNIWDVEPFLDAKLKNQSLPDERKIIHNDVRYIISYDWRVKTSNVLARAGIRP